MNYKRAIPYFFHTLATLLVVAGILVTPNTASAEDDILPLWTDGPAKETIISFVQAVTTPGDDFVEPENRIAAFDNDGTLIPEYPSYYLFIYAHERFKAIAPEHPEWETEQIYKELVNDDLDTALALNYKKTCEILMRVIAEDNPETLSNDIRAWLDSKHPSDQADGRTYAQMAYAPMLELIEYLKANEFKIYIVTGSEAEFARVLAAQMYNLPPEQVIGSDLRYKLEAKDNKSQITRQSKLDTINDGEEKPLNLQRRVGRTPILAFGNADGDVPMLLWTTAAPGKRLALLLHHTDDEREFAYDKSAKNGKLRKGLELAEENNWVVVDMKNDWTTVFADF